jgi:solute carrier family 39 (zinc transporter), member 11
MIEGENSVYNAFLGTLLTWGLTALGAAVVFVLPKGDHRELMDASLGFAAGVMLAASYWSLLAPSIEKAEELKYTWTWFPAAVGFALGGLGIKIAEMFLPEGSGDILKAVGGAPDGDDGTKKGTPKSKAVRKRKTARSKSKPRAKKKVAVAKGTADGGDAALSRSYRRILLLVVAITIHNFPEGLAVGVGFGAVEKGSMTIQEARTLAWGIGLQNFPEGLAVSLPLYRAGMGMMKSFWYGQLSGMVEPIAGVLGALLIQFAEPVLPYALSFAAGAMIYVVVDDLIPEVCESGNTTYSTWGCMAGFIVMMVMDVALG